MKFENKGSNNYVKGTAKHEFSLKPRENGGGFNLVVVIDGDYAGYLPCIIADNEIDFGKRPCFLNTGSGMKKFPKTNDKLFDIIGKVEGKLILSVSVA